MKQAGMGLNNDQANLQARVPGADGARGAVSRTGTTVCAVRTRRYGMKTGPKPEFDRQLSRDRAQVHQLTQFD